ncbi:MAG: TRAP transporter small permease [Sphaerochaetaceae bacterium]|jgi:TRAP-type C4-dicarboxylate transport system permease small subunit|nr:TRAP transporter small permease [Sphaerochaetaceae bacterium]MDC7238088.1 TRAP transporter small permease [Sphaerochaetaceae bacterium]MDC7250777.1 TRAP transporter small permease [Sphaerochaetaceae bacterium]
MKKIIISLSELFYKLFKELDIILLLILAILTFSGVISRYLFNSPLVWLYELTLVLFSWIIFGGISIAFKTGENIRVDLFGNHRKKLKRVFAIVGNIFTIIFLLVVIKNGITIISTTWSQQYNTIDISTAWFYIPFPLCGFVSLIHIVSSLLQGKNPLIHVEEDGGV